MPIKDQDKSDEQTPKGAQTVRETTRVSSPKADRIAGAYFLGGVWYAPDGSVLTAVETQQAHKAMDAAAAQAKRRALLGRSE